MLDSSQIRFYVGTYTQRGSQGIYSSHLDILRGTFTAPQLAAELEHPTWLVWHRNILYAASTVDAYLGTASGSVVAYAINETDGTLSLLAQHPSHGTRPCYLSVDYSGTALLAGNFGTGSVAVFPIQSDGSIDPASDVQQCVGSSIHPVRQQGPHIHCVVPVAVNNHVIAVDLGSDRLWIYQLIHNRLVPAAQPFVGVQPGTGPRHLAFHPSGRFVYVNSELDSTINVFRYDGERLDYVNTWSTLPDDYAGHNTGAHLLISADGRFLYSSNRGHDSFAIFAVDSQNGHLDLVSTEAVQGKSPRHFALDPSERFVICANQDSDSITLFERDEKSGTLSFMTSLSIPSPVCICLR